METQKLAKASLLHRRISISATPYGVGSPSPPHPPSLNLELISLHKPSPSLASYTSLKDVISSSAADVFSPSAASPVAAADISIRNRLVKQAAFAYLQPTTPTPSANPSFLRRLTSTALRLIAAVFNAFRLFPSIRSFFRF